MIREGETAPDFALPGVEGGEPAIYELFRPIEAGDAVVLWFVPTTFLPTATAELRAIESAGWHECPRLRVWVLTTDTIYAAADGDRHYVAVDPLDGSSNLKSNNTMGTLFGVYDEPLPADGSALVASGFVLYGPITTMAVARGGTVTESVIDEGDRRVVDPDLTLPEEPTVYGFGGRVPRWSEEFSAYVSEVESELKLRYGGAMIGDVSQVLTYGGIFGYPGLRDRPEGKLRLCFEGHPIAHIVETAGGASSNGERSLLSLTPDRLHERTPLFVGNEAYIDRLEAALG
jgi:fructose-1,6-bisphosphatase I